MHLAVEPFTARDGARYWLRIAIFAYPACIRRPRGSRRDITVKFGVEKLEWRGYPMLKNFEDMFIRFDRIRERGGQTDGHRMAAAA